MSRASPKITLGDEDAEILRTWARRRSMPYRRVVRARLILLAAEGFSNKEIAKSLKLSCPTVQLWRERFLSLGIKGLVKDATRPGRKKKLSPEVSQAVIHDTLNVRPEFGSRWTTREIARVHGISEASARRIWREHGIAPHRAEKHESKSAGTEPQRNFDSSIVVVQNEKQRNVRRKPETSGQPAPKKRLRSKAARQAFYQQRVGQLARRKRIELGFEAEEFARHCKLPLETLLALEAGDFDPAGTTVEVVAAGLGMHYTELLLYPMSPAKKP